MNFADDSVPPSITKKETNENTPADRMSLLNEYVTRFCCSGASCMFAGTITNPIDVIKVRLQLDNQLTSKKSIFTDRYYPGFFRGVLVVINDEGISGLYKGVTASLMREGIYSTLRLGAYEPVKGLLGASTPLAPLWKKVFAGAITGSVGSAIANPTDLVKIRMQGQGKLKPGEKRRYKNVFSAFTCIVKNDGISGLWRGVVPNVQRAALVSATQIPAYDHTKTKLKENNVMSEGLQLHFISSLIAGFVTSIITSPLDVIKTRTMNECIISRNSVTYSTTVCSFLKILRSEGILGFYKGLFPNWLRTGPHTMITFLAFEQLRILSGLPPV